jgi:hypothetical protein
MSPNRRPIGVWITTIYLFVLLALGVFYLVLAIDAANAQIVVHQAVGVLIVLSGILLLGFLSKWSVPIIGLMATLQASTFLSYLMTDGSQFIAVQGSDAVMQTFLVAFNFMPLAILAATLAALLYTAWLWHACTLT